MSSQRHRKHEAKKSKSSKNGLSKRYRTTLYALAALLWTTGVAWALLHTYGKQGDAFMPTPHPYEKTFLQLHGALAPLWLILLGSLIPWHILPNLHLKPSRGSGLLLLAINFILLGTGYLLYYIAHEKMRLATSQIHLWLGIAFLPLLFIHVWLSRRV